MSRPTFAQNGFSLIELSIVMVIVALLSSGLIFGLGAQRTASANADARRQLDNIGETLSGFAIVNGRLPCPAKPTLSSGDANAGLEDCGIAGGHGVLPWATLGLPETDPWGNRFSYYAHDKFTAPVASGALSSFALDTPGNANVRESSAAGNDIASALPAVIVCHGSRAGGAYRSNGSKLAGASGDEAENTDADLLFIARPPDDGFDDLLAWIVPSQLKSRMVAAGKLP